MRAVRREHATHEPLISRAMLVEVPLAGLSFAGSVVARMLSSLGWVAEAAIVAAASLAAYAGLAL